MTTLRLPLPVVLFLEDELARRTAGYSPAPDPDDRLAAVGDDEHLREPESKDKEILIIPPLLVKSHCQLKLIGLR